MKIILFMVTLAGITSGLAILMVLLRRRAPKPTQN